MKKILITGSSGFIGSFLVEKALGKGWETWAGIRGTSNREFLTDSKTLFIDLPFQDKEKLKAAISAHVAEQGRWDYVIHNAGLTKCLNPNDFDRVNFQYTAHLVQALIETGNVPEKFILMSSLSAGQEYPQTVYGLSKQKAECFLQSQSDFPYIILRPTGVYGPREKDYLMMVKTIRSGFNPGVGFQAQKLTFIYVKDLVKVAFLVLESPVKNRLYTIADGQVYSDKEYARIVKQVLNKKRVISIRIPLFVLKTVSVFAEFYSKISRCPSTLNRDKYKIMAHRDWTCDTELIKKELGFAPDYNLQKGMEETVAWYREYGWI